MMISRLPRSALVLVVGIFATLSISLATHFLVKVLRRSSASCQGLARTWGRFMLWISGVKVTRQEEGNLDRRASYIFASNHQSQYDIFVLQAYLGHDFRWLAKKELFRVPVWGGAMRAAGYIPIDRSRGRAALKSLAEAAAKIAGGTSVVIFPEGTRSRDGRLQEFKTGGILLAIKAGVPVVPVAISGTHAVLPKGKLLVGPGRVRLRIGSPVEVAGYSAGQKQELAELLRSRVEALLK